MWLQRYPEWEALVDVPEIDPSRQEKVGEFRMMATSSEAIIRALKPPRHAQDRADMAQDATTATPGLATDRRLYHIVTHQRASRLTKQSPPMLGSQ